MTPQEKSEFLSSFGNAFELDDKVIDRPWGSEDGLPVIVEKPAVEDLRRGSVPEKQSVTKSFSWSGARTIRKEGLHDTFKSKDDYHNSTEHLKERLSYLMPYSHKIGPDDVLPSLQLNRSRCYSMPFIKSPLLESDPFKILDNDNEDLLKSKRLDTSLESALAKVALSSGESLD